MSKSVKVGKHEIRLLVKYCENNYNDLLIFFVKTKNHQKPFLTPKNLVDRRVFVIVLRPVIF